MPNQENQKIFHFYTILKDLLLSDWVNYPVPSYEDFDENNLVDIVDLISKKIYEAYYQIIKKNLDEGLVILNQVEGLIAQCDSYNFLFDYYLLKTEIFIAKYQIQDAFDTLKSFEPSLFSSSYNSYHYFIRRARFFKLLSMVYHELKDFNLALETSFKGINLCEKYQFIHKTFEFYIYNSIIYRHLGDISKANESVLKCLDIAYNLNDFPKQISCFNLLSGIAQENGDYKKGVEYAQNGLNIARQHDSPNIYLCLTSLANSYWRLGYLKEVLPLLNESEQILQKIGNKRYLFSYYNNLGLYFVTCGDYSEALDNFQKALQFNLETKYDIQLPYVYSNLANLYYEMNNLEMSEFYFLKTLEVSEKTKNLQFQIDSLTGLILLSSLWNNKDKCSILLDKLSILMESSTTIIDELRYELAQGYTLESSNNIEDNKKAISIYEKLIHSESSDFEINNSAYLHYCKTWFKLYIDFGIIMDWNTIKKHLETLQYRAKELNLFNTYLTSKIVLSKILTLDEKFDDAEIILNEIIDEAELRGFDLILKMSKEAMDTFKKIKFGSENLTFAITKSKEQKKLIEKDIIEFINNLV